VVGLAVGVVTAIVGVGVLVLVGVALLGIPFGRLERARLQIMGTGALPDPHVPVLEPGVVAAIRARLREPATWRELGALLLAAVPLLALDVNVLLFAVIVPGVLIASPVLVASGERVDIVRFVVDTTAESWAACAAGLVLLAVALYLVTAYAAARASLLRLVLAAREHELERAVGRLEGSRARIARSFDAERLRIERDLHDGAQQHLVGLATTVGLARLEAARLPDARQLTTRLDQAASQVTAALGALRETVRGIHPQVLTDRGLGAAVEAAAGRSALPVEVDVDLDRRLPAEVEAAAYFAVCELLANAAEHSGASAIDVRGRCGAGRLWIEVRDDGRGGALLRKPGGDGRGSGLIGISDRLAVNDGAILVDSPPGGPTVVTIELPLDTVPLASERR
jgi:signal transduction histidine kinase